MKKIVLYCLVFILSLPLIGISQEKPVQTEDKGRVVVVAQKSDGPMLLYVINGRYYLGDTTLIRSLDVSKVKKIEEIKDEKEKAKHSKKTGKFSDRVQGIFVIETDEKIDLPL